ncbi:MAG: hypothetical protein HRU41_24275 [Saprospiraceae bacterium]|nr:hypothetical protein [Saprospiraceae bacterium]
MHRLLLLFIVLGLSLFYSCEEEITSIPTRSRHVDEAFTQVFAVKFQSPSPELELRAMETDRNGDIQVLTPTGLYHCQDGKHLYPGALVPYHRHRPMTDMQINAIGLHSGQFVYANQEAVFSNAHAARTYILHELDAPSHLCPSSDGSYLLAQGNELVWLKNDASTWKGKVDGQNILGLESTEKGQFFVLTQQQVLEFSPQTKQLRVLYQGDKLTAFDLDMSKDRLVVTSKEGYFTIELNTTDKEAVWYKALPHLDLTAVTVVENTYWFGSRKGAFSVAEKGQVRYYHGQRWLVDNEVVSIRAGKKGLVIILTKTGLSQIHQQAWTLAEKAAFYDQQVRDRHIRYGFNASLARLEEGNPSTGYLVDSDNDGLWTSMYLGGEAFRYAVTKDPEALANCEESLAAMEHLYDINPVSGFQSRSFERHGYLEQLADPHRWHTAPDPRWDWKGTTSSDEAIGHMFVFGVLADLAPSPALKDKSIELMDTLMSHVLRHDLYLVDYDGKPTTWGRWNPKYVNARPKMVGDRKLNSSNIIGMLQTAYHFTQKEKYKEKAYELMEEHGYLDNLLFPMTEVGMAPEEADDWSKMLSEEWNHSDDEMYFLGYWGLYRYAFTDSLRSLYREAIIEHWELERPEKEGLWNIFTALVEPDSFDLSNAIWYLQEYPLDLIDWSTENSHRQDIVKIGPNFRNQTTEDVLPPGETKISRHNANRFRLDSQGGGRSEYSAGDIWLLPYWMGRYLDVISPPVIP